MPNQEQISLDFDIPDIEVEQTISKSFDPFSGIAITSSYVNTKIGLLDSNSDGRVPLGLFVFEEDNVFSNNFPDKISDPKFTQIEVTNLIENGNGQSVKSFYSPSGDSETLGGIQINRTEIIPEGGWGHCRFDGVVQSDRLHPIHDGFDYNISNGSNYAGDADFIGSKYHVRWGGYFGFEGNTALSQYYTIPGRTDTQNFQPYAGYYPYHTLLELQRKLNDVLTDDNLEYNNMCNTFLASVMDENKTSKEETYGAGDYKTAHRFTPTIALDGVSDGAIFPNFAHWSNFIEGASFGRALEFTATNYKAAYWNWNQDNNEDDLNQYNNDGANVFHWTWTGDYLNGIANHQYRTLNQVIRIYENGGDTSKETEIQPFTTMRVKFRMYTKYIDENIGFPEVETAIIDGDGSVSNPLREDVVGEKYHLGTDGVNTYSDDGGYEDGSPMYFKGYGYPKNFHYRPDGDFNSVRYDGDNNQPGTLNNATARFGSVCKFKNSEIGKWETFSYSFTLSDKFRYSSTGRLRDLYFMVQSSGVFAGTVYLDDFQVYADGDFTPDVDVRKKISTGVYGKADLTKYWDKDIHLEEYPDSTGPLEAQFYFYPNYPSEKIFDVKRTPMYRDFAEGKFYLYDINWGDGSNNDFITEPKNIDENTAVFHKYETSGIFEVTGYMIRLEKETDNKPRGIISNKRFTLRININEGVGEDFKFFGSNGYSFIPYKNTVPMIGGYSEQSIYYKTLKRQLGYLIVGDDTFMDNIEEQYNNINYTSIGSIGLNEIYQNLGISQQSYESENIFGGGPAPFGPPLFDTTNNGIYDQGVPLRFHYDADTIDKFVYEREADGVMENSLKINESNDYYTLKWTGRPQEGSWSIVYFNYIQASEEPDYANSIITHNFHSLTLFKLVAYKTPVKITVNFNSQGDRLKTELALLKLNSKFKNFNEVLPEYIKPRNLEDGTRIYNGIHGGTLEQEIGKSIGDTDIASIKYYNTPKPMWEILGFENDIAGNPDEERYWKNIIPQDYSIYNRDIYTENGKINIYSQQDWLHNYYYPVLPRYSANGKFILGNYPNNKIPFPLEGPITDENEGSKNLLINISSEEVESNTLNDKSGNQNLGCVFSDYKPVFDNETFKPKQFKASLVGLETSKTNGVF